MNVEQGRPKRRRWVFGGLMLGLGLAVAAWGGRNVYSTTIIGAAYVAKQTCSCMFVVGRTAQSCRGDYDAEAVRVLSVKTEPSSVTVTAFGGMLSSRAEFETDFGCHLVN
jgi:hypothetical protein